jgi:hypothetical protein
MICLLSTFYMTKILAYKEFFFLWVSLIMFSGSGLYAIAPGIIAKSFGQKNFTAIFGFTLLTYVR